MIEKPDNVDNQSDEILMQNIKNGNLEGMAVLFERYHRKLYNFFLRMGLKQDESQDLTQNLFYRMIKYRTSYKTGKNVRTWIYQIARNLFNDYSRIRSRSGELFLQTDKIPACIEDDNGTYEEEDYEKLERSLAFLSDGQREILVMNRFMGLKYEEISVIVNQSVPAIKVTMHRAIKQLRSAFFKQV